MRATKSLVTARLTSASRSAMRTSRKTSPTSDSVRRPRERKRAKIAPRRSESPSSTEFRAHRVDLGDGVADSFDLLGFLVGNVDVELGFECHYQLDLIERVRAQIVGNRR